jgi:hypothetical protein
MSETKELTPGVSSGIDRLSVVYGVDVFADHSTLPPTTSTDSEK